MKVMLIPILAATVLATGCASSHCTGSFPYQRAQSLPPPQKVEGLKLPESPSALKIPPAPANPIAFAEPVGKDLRCLDVPPPMVPETTPAPAEAPKS